MCSSCTSREGDAMQASEAEASTSDACAALEKATAVAEAAHAEAAQIDRGRRAAERKLVRIVLSVCAVLVRRLCSFLSLE